MKREKKWEYAKSERKSSPFESCPHRVLIWNELEASLYKRINIAEIFGSGTCRFGVTEWLPKIFYRRRFIIILFHCYGIAVVATTSKYIKIRSITRQKSESTFQFHLSWKMKNLRLTAWSDIEFKLVQLWMASGISQTIHIFRIRSCLCSGKYWGIWPPLHHYEGYHWYIYMFIYELLPLIDGESQNVVSIFMHSNQFFHLKSINIAYSRCVFAQQTARAPLSTAGSHITTIHVSSAKIKFGGNLLSLILSPAFTAYATATPKKKCSHKIYRKCDLVFLFMSRTNSAHQNDEWFYYFLRMRPVEGACDVRLGISPTWLDERRPRGATQFKLNSEYPLFHTYSAATCEFECIQIASHRPAPFAFVQFYCVHLSHLM